MDHGYVLLGYSNAEVCLWIFMDLRRNSTWLTKALLHTDGEHPCKRQRQRKWGPSAWSTRTSTGSTPSAKPSRSYGPSDWVVAMIGRRPVESRWPSTSSQPATSIHLCKVPRHPASCLHQILVADGFGGEGLTFEFSWSCCESNLKLSWIKPSCFWQYCMKNRGAR